MTINTDEYGSLADTGFDSFEPTDPKDDFFHSIYIGGIDRKNPLGVTEEAGKLHIRGVDYNQTQVNMIITHIKQILVKMGKGRNNREVKECFCYQTQQPWQGTTVDESTGQKRLCGQNSAERAANDFCSTCRSQILVAGILCDANGTPIKSEEKKPVFAFVRARGMKYSNVADYLSDVAKLEVTDPVTDPSTPGSERFEKTIVNNKRVVTEITVGEANSRFGIKKVFELNIGARLPKNATLEVLKIAKKTVEKFNEKFDWSSQKMGSSDYGTASGPSEDQKIPDSQSAPPAAEPKKEEASFSFEEAEFDF